MTAEIMATVENGILKLDEPFPDQTRVKLTIEPIESESQAWVAWKTFLAKIDEHPIIGDGTPFNRDELYERD